MIIFDEAHPDIAYTLAPNLCANDRDWIEHSYEPGTPHEEAVRDTLESSEQSFAITDDEGTLLGAFGHGPWDRTTGLGCVWLLSTPRLFAKHFGDLARAFRRSVIPTMDQVYTMYGCTILTQNNTLMKWLKLNGFEPLTSCDRTGAHFTTLIRQ